MVSHYRGDFFIIKADTGVDDCLSVLDCSVGDGRSLGYLTKCKLYAVEINKILIYAIDKSIFIVGTEFERQTLIDKFRISVNLSLCFQN